MGRKKGSKLTTEQKERMAQTRLKKSKKIEEIATVIPIKKDKNQKLIAAYGYTDMDDHVIPIFTSEVDSFKGKMYKTLEKASLKFNEERK